MEDSRQTKAQLLAELTALRHRVDTLEERAAERLDVLQHAPHGILVHRDFQPLFVNQVWAQMHGYASPDAIFELSSLLDCYAPEEHVNLREHHTVCTIGTASGPSYKVQGRCQDGTTFWKEEDVMASHWDGHPAFVITSRDLTERRQTEAALQQSKVFFDSIVDQLPNMIFVKDAQELKFVHINKAGEELLGYCRDELIGKSDYDFFPPQEADFFTAKDRRVLADGQLEDIPEEPIHTRHQGLRILHTKKIPLSDATGQQQYLLGISEDITLRKQTEQALQKAHDELEDRVGERTAALQRANAELRVEMRDRQLAQEALRESETNFRNLVETSIQGVFIHTDGIIQFANASTAHIFGYSSPDDLVGQDYRIVVAPEEEARVEGYRHARLRSELAPSYYECEGRRQDGSPLWFACLVSRVIWNGRTSIMSTFHDISARKQAEQALRESEERFRDLVEGSVQGVVVHRHLVPLFVNQRYAEILGYDSPEEIFQLGSLEPVLAPEERPRVRSYVQKRQAGQPVAAHQEHRAVRKDGTRIWLDVRVRQIQWDHASAIQVAIFDITERKEAEEALQQAKNTLEQRVQERTADLQRVNAQLRNEMSERRQAQEALLQAERFASLGTLAAGIAHELNNPLGAITMTAEHARNNLTGPHTPDSIRECFDDILSDAHRCAETIKRTLQFARQGYPNKTIVDLHVVIVNACNIARGYAQQHGVRLSLTRVATSLRIRANAEEMELALVNLIRNAVEAGHHGAEVHVGTEVEAARVHITIRDTGVGLTEEEQQYVFDPFYTTRPNAGGTGLGLSITHRIITHHEGTIDLCSQPGQGTIVRIELPLVV